jgi:acyl-CoA synthetase (AMP-forming)/AMP-acid ligase II
MFEAMTEVISQSLHGFASTGNEHQVLDFPLTQPETTTKPRTIDELLRLRSYSHGDEPILGYPDDNGDYVEYSFRQLDELAFQVAQNYAKIIPPRRSSEEKEKVVALLGPSTLEYLISILALSKLGCTVLFLSTRISVVAYQSLLESTSCHHLLIHSSFKETAKELQSGRPLLTVENIADLSDIEQKTLSLNDDTRINLALKPEVESQKIAWIIHSSGSTGLPKPIFQTHSAALNK